MTFSLSRIEGGTFVTFLVILFVLIAVATFGYFQKTGQLEEYKVNMFSSIGTDELALEEDIDMDINVALEGGADISAVKDEGDLSIGVTGQSIAQIDSEQGEELEENFYILPSTGKQYKETAERGDGITNLARRAVEQYLTENSPELTSEHKIFVEDYVQNRIGDRDLQVGEEVSISEDLIKQGINDAQELSAEQLENLENFTELVWETGFRL